MSLCLLTVSVAHHLHELVEDVLLAAPELVPGFTVSEGLGHGSEVRLVSTREKVHGHARQMLFQIIAGEAACQQVLARIGQEVPQSGAFYWLTPVLAAGRLA